jgi:D-alanyl-D-alanine carboxypeptidase (penicillin-binding protein 5/6)
MLFTRGTAAQAMVEPRGAFSRNQLGQLDAGPAVSARAVFVVDVTAGVELWSVNADEPLPPASTAKIVTALTIRRFLAPEERVTVTATDLVDPAVYSHAGLQLGDELTVRDLLAALLIVSAGDAAQALARAAGERIAPSGSDPIAAFVAVMNEDAQRMGLTRSRFLTPDGRDVPGQVTTARELAVAAAQLLADPVLAPLVAADRMEIVIEGANARRQLLVNTNQLAGARDVLGVKTGTSPEAGQCLVLALRRGHDTVLIVLLGSRDRYRDAEAIREWLDTRYRWITLDGASFPELATLAARGIVPALTPTFLVPAESLDCLRLEIVETTSAGRWRGAVRLQFGTSDLAVVPLIEARREGQARRPG